MRSIAACVSPSASATVTCNRLPSCLASTSPGMAVICESKVADWFPELSSVANANVLTRDVKSSNDVSTFNRPATITATRSAIRSTSSSRWVLSSTVRLPPLANSINVSFNARRLTGSKPNAGSSNTSSSGSGANNNASDTPARCPLDNVPTRADASIPKCETISRNIVSSHVS